MTAQLTVYVPRSTTHHIAAGSGIVAATQADSPERITVYYEGDIYRPTTPADYADRVDRAAGRLLEAYPTVARASLPADTLTAVADYDAENGVIHPYDTTALAALAAWTGAANPDDLSLVTRANGYHTRLREWTAASYSPDPHTARFAQDQLLRLTAAHAH